jgi:lipid-A-disaccharide synthase
LMNKLSVLGTKVFIIAGEASGDQLGAGLMKAMFKLHPSIHFKGVGGTAMETQTRFKSIFPMSDIAVMGIIPVLLKLPILLQRIKQTARAIIDSKPDVLIIIDSPDFTHRVAKIIRKAAPHIPIINYVSPTVWAWRSGRARKMRPYVDHLLAVLPFEPSAHARLGGPACSYVGHPLMERLDELQPNEFEQAQRDSSSPLVLVLPGSRRSEIHRLMPIFGEAIALLSAARPELRFALPAVPHVRADIVELIKTWQVKPIILDGENNKHIAFRQARGAMAASGTVTLELALAQIPMVTAYKVSKLEELIFRALTNIQSVILPNIILDRQAIPEFLQENCTAANLNAALLPFLSHSDERNAQVHDLKEVVSIMQVEGGNPSDQAAKIVLSMLKLN